MNVQPDSVRRLSSDGRIALGVHLLLIVVVFTYIGWCLAVSSSGGDANIGLGMGLLALGALGFPWSGPVLWSDVTVDSWMYVVVATGGAALNVALHTFVWAWSASRARHR